MTVAGLSEEKEDCGEVELKLLNCVDIVPAVVVVDCGFAVPVDDSVGGGGNCEGELDV